MTKFNETIETTQIDLPDFDDRFERIEDETAIFAIDALKELSLTVPKEGVDVQIFKRRIVKPFAENGNKTYLVAKCDNVFLYIDEEGDMLLTTNGEVR